MKNSIVPDWVREMQTEKEQTEANAETETLHRLVAEKAIQADGPKFWKQLLKELKITVDSLASLNIRASMIECSSRVSSDESYRISLTGSSASVRHTSIDLFYSAGGPQIRYCLLGRDPSHMDLCFKDEGEGRGSLVLFYDNRLLSPSEAAQAIINPMTLYVMGKKR